MSELNPQEKQNILMFIIREYYKKNGYNKTITIDYLADEATRKHFIKFLNDIYNEIVDYNINGYDFSNSYDKDDENYFGDDKICFVWNSIPNQPIQKEILTYKEFCEYLEIACGFYIGFNKEQKEEVTILFNKIKKKFLNLE